ncbi:MAG: hypothetical protein ACJAVI_004526 [Candidatus Azotimanducaceae bacterium]|jgi:hypothetical protein
MKALTSITTAMFLLISNFPILANAKEPSPAVELRLSGVTRGGLGLGIPAPNGNVPADIMPTVPSSANQIAAFPYDPRTIAAPVWVDGPKQYYVDSSIACDDNNNGGRGSETSPRCTLPNVTNNRWQLDAGSHVFIKGNGATYGNKDDIIEMKMPGTANDPIWILGVSDPSTPRWTNQPLLNYERFQSGDAGTVTHVLFDNVHFNSATDDFRGAFESVDGGGKHEYITLRHLTCTGSGLTTEGGVASDQSRRCFRFQASENNPVRFIFLFDLDIFGLGRWVDDFDTDRDMHGLQLQGPVYYYWLMNSRIFHNQGDSIQCSNSNIFDFKHATRPHYVYIGGNEFYENYENGYDSKGCYHVVFSENFVHGFFNAIKPANATAITTAQDGESYLGDNYAWFLNNKLENVGDAFFYKGTEDDAFSYILGNLAVNITGDAAFPIEGRCTTNGNQISTCGDGMYAALNTLDCGKNSGAVKANRNGGSSDPAITDAEKNADISFVGNVFFDCTDSPNDSSSPHGFENSNSNWSLTYNYNVDFRTFGGDISLSKFNDEEIGNLTNVDPILTNPSGDLTTGNYEIKTGSQARRLITTEPAVYSLFSNLYGLDIRKDLNGKVWKPGSILTPGAYQ